MNLAGTFATLHDAVTGAIAGYLALWCVYWVFRLLRGVEGMGYGDFKLLAALGAWLGWSALPQIVVIAAIAGAVVGLVATWSGRRRFDEPLPFGPYLAGAALVTLFAGLVNAQVVSPAVSAQVSEWLSLNQDLALVAASTARASARPPGFRR